MDYQKKLIINTDGGSRGNPGPAGIGVVIKDGEKSLLLELGEAIGNTTNNVAEYTAVLTALRLVKEHNAWNASTISFLLDSLLVVSQLTGVYKIKDVRLQGLCREIKTFERELGIPISYSHVRREFNKEADLLVNRALDNTLSLL